MDAQQLWERFTDLSVEEGVDLERFCQLARDGALDGQPVTPEVLQAFLRRIEAQMLANIETKLEEAPHLQARRDEAVEQIQELVARLIDRYAAS